MLFNFKNSSLTGQIKIKFMVKLKIRTAMTKKWLNRISKLQISNSWWAVWMNFALAICKCSIRPRRTFNCTHIYWGVKESLSKSPMFLFYSSPMWSKHELKNWTAIPWYNLSPSEDVFTSNVNNSNMLLKTIVICE